MIKTLLFKGCEDLTMDRFIRISVKEDLGALVKRRGIIKAKRKDLESRWAEIYQAYSDLSADDSGIAYLNLLKQKTLLNNKVHLIQWGLMALSKRRNESLIKVLKKMGLKGSFSKETFQKDMARSLIQLKSLISKLQKVEKNLKPFMSGKGMTENDFIEVFTVLSRHQGYRIDPGNTTVIEFINLLNSYKKWQMPKK